MLVSSPKKRDIHQFKRDRPQKNGTVPAKTGRMVTLVKQLICCTVYKIHRISEEATRLLRERNVKFTNKIVERTTVSVCNINTLVKQKMPLMFDILILLKLVNFLPLSVEKDESEREYSS